MESETILVIDDEAVIRSLLSDVLSEEGYTVVTAATGEEGYEAAMSGNFDLIMLDLLLPGEDGMKIIKHIRSNDPDALYIVITGQGTMENIRGAIRDGAFDFLTKPFDLEQLKFAVRRAMKQANLEKTNKRLMKELSEQNRLLEEKVYERTKRLETAIEHLQQVNLRIITTLISIIEAKDAYTRSHSEHVASYSVAIARALGLSDVEIETINKAAQLHDIGKIGIYDSILNKPGKLTPEEFEEVKRHPAKAEEILKPLSFLTYGVDLILQHHERFDGKGYPNGIKGDDILLGARIMAVADAFDAMMSQRPYRENALTKEEIIEEIKRNSGSQFDPRVVDAFLTIIDKLVEERNSQ